MKKKMVFVTERRNKRGKSKRERRCSVDCGSEGGVVEDSSLLVSEALSSGR